MVHAGGLQVQNNYIDISQLSPESILQKSDKVKPKIELNLLNSKGMTIEEREKELLAEFELFED